MACHLKSIAKALSWRFVGAIDTLILGYLVTGNWHLASAVVGFEFFTKTFLYYSHERAWEWMQQQEE